MGRQDNIWICKTGKTIFLSNMYEDYKIRPELLKSKAELNTFYEEQATFSNCERLIRNRSKIFKLLLLLYKSCSSRF